MTNSRVQTVSGPSIGADGIIIPTAANQVTPAADGDTVKLTIDSDLQFYSQNAIEKQVQVQAPGGLAPMLSSDKAGTSISGKRGLSACRTTPRSVILSRLIVSSPSRTATATEPSLGSSSRFTISSSPSLLPACSMDCPGDLDDKGADHLLDQMFGQINAALKVVLGRR